jgi:uncharacterized protein (UPF0332 family)
LSDLLKGNTIRRVEPDELQARDCLNAAERDLESAKNNLRLRDFDWALAIAYNAMLQATRALMFKEGYSAVGENYHRAVVEYAEVKLESRNAGLARYFDVLRKRRNHSVYDRAGTVLKREAEEAILRAKELVGLVTKKIGGC